MKKYYSFTYEMRIAYYKVGKLRIFIFQGPHSEEHPGEWVWEHANTTVQWFDWAPNQPDNWHRQQCLAFVRYSVWGVS